jgi:hypothetical protein
VSVDSAAYRVAGSPAGTPRARSSPAPEHDPPPSVSAQGLEVSRGDVLQDQLLQAQLTYQPLQLRVLRLKLLQPSRLVHPKTAVLFAPAIVALLRDFGLFTGQRCRLALRHCHFDLRSRFTTCSAVYFFLPIPSSLRLSLSHRNWYKRSGRPLPPGCEPSASAHRYATSARLKRSPSGLRNSKRDGRVNERGVKRLVFTRSMLVITIRPAMSASSTRSLQYARKPLHCIVMIDLVKNRWRKIESPHPLMPI